MSHLARTLLATDLRMMNCCLASAKVIAKRSHVYSGDMRGLFVESRLRF